MASTFEALFGRAPSTRARAAGRVNLMGDHTDYNGGFVLPMVIPQETRVELAPGDGRRVRAASANIDGGPAEFELGAERRTGQWFDYLQGVTQQLARAGHGERLRGFDVRLESNVPVGSGLSSSAALEVALLRALRDAYRLDLDDVTLAKLAQRVETEFVGAPIGIMDQMVVSLGHHGAALFLDTRALTHREVPIPVAFEVVVISSGLAHRNVDGGYPQRRAECEAAARALGVPQLRDLTPADLPRIETLPEPLRRRARHVVTEDARVHAMVAALEQGDRQALGAILHASHASLRDDFQTSLPEIDLLIELTRAQPGCVGARITGGGFGGSIVALADAGTGRALARAAAAAYASKTAQKAAVLVPA